ncbi:hypothetical protein [Kitasatospora griseola]
MPDSRRAWPLLSGPGSCVRELTAVSTALPGAGPVLRAVAH